VRKTNITKSNSITWSIITRSISITWRV